MSVFVNGLTDADVLALAERIQLVQAAGKAEAAALAAATPESDGSGKPAKRTKTKAT